MVDALVERLAVAREEYLAVIAEMEAGTVDTVANELVKAYAELAANRLLVSQAEIAVKDLSDKVDFLTRNVGVLEEQIRVLKNERDLAKLAQETIQAAFNAKMKTGGIVLETK